MNLILISLSLSSFDFIIKQFSRNTIREKKIESIFGRINAIINTKYTTHCTHIWLNNEKIQINSLNTIFVTGAMLYS